jgi:GT2 family glycosyltransferase
VSADQPHGSASTSPSLVSVVMPTFNRCESLQRALEALATQRVDRAFELVVVSDGSTDGTDDYLANVQLGVPLVAIRQQNGGPASARNHGVNRASGDLIVFVDDDVVAAPGLIQAHVDAHQRHGDQAVVIGPMLNPPDHKKSSWVAWEQEMLNKQYTALDQHVYEATAIQFYTGNASVRTEHLQSVGGFDESFKRAEDVELAFRLADLGLRFHYERSAAGWHYAERQYDSWVEAARMYGRNAVIFARDRNQPWMYEFVRSSFSRQHPAIRMLILATSPPLGARLVRPAVQRVAQRRSVRQRHNRPTRYALSCVYAIEFYGGVIDELGSVEGFRNLLRTGHQSDD